MGFIALTLTALALGAEPASPLLDRLFGAGLSEEQRGALGPGATHEQLAGAMTPRQRAAAREGLAAAEARARTPRELKEIARGYLILDEKAPNAGQEALRLAGRLLERDPQDPEARTLAAGGFFQLGDHAKAAEAAEAALRLDPRNRAAAAVLLLSRGRGGRVPAGEAGVQGVSEPPPRPPAKDGREGPGLPYKLPVRAGHYKSVPTGEWQAAKPAETFRQKLDRMVHGQATRAVGRFQWLGDMTDEEGESAVEMTKTGAVVGTAVGAGAGAVFGGVTCGPALFTGAPYALCTAASSFAGAAAGGFTAANLTAFGSLLYLKTDRRIQEMTDR